MTWIQDRRDGSDLPSELVSKATAWLDIIEHGLSRIDQLARELDPGERNAVTEATADVRTTTRHFRDALTSQTFLDSRPDTRWMPLSHPSAKFAERAHQTVNEIARTPFDLLVLVNAKLSEPTRGRFLLLIGRVVGEVFTNLARGLWESFPELAPPDWIQAADADSELTEFLIRRTDEGEWFDLNHGDMPTVLRPRSVASEVIPGFGELRLKIGEVEASLSFEDPGIQVTFYGKIDPLLARRLVDEMAEQLAQHTGQSATIVAL